jgi:hypothetical protein
MAKAQMSEESDSLLQLLSQLRESIKTAQLDLDDRGTAFKLTEVEVEANITVSKSANGGIKLHLITLGTDVKKEHVHKIKLKVVPTALYENIADAHRPTAAPRPPLKPPGSEEDQ